MSRLDGKVSIITGASHGLGRGIALAFGREGSLMVLAARSLERLRSVAEEIHAGGGRAEVISTDVSDEAQVDSLFAQAQRLFGRVDILVNNAAFLGGAPLD